MGHMKRLHHVGMPFRRPVGRVAHDELSSRSPAGPSCGGRQRGYGQHWPPSTGLPTSC